MIEAAAAANLWRGSIGELGLLSDAPLTKLQTQIDQSIAEARAWLLERSVRDGADAKPSLLASIS